MVLNIPRQRTGAHIRSSGFLDRSQAKFSFDTEDTGPAYTQTAFTVLPPQRLQPYETILSLNRQKSVPTHTVKTVTCARCGCLVLGVTFCVLVCCE